MSRGHRRFIGRAVILGLLGPAVLASAVSSRAATARGSAVCTSWHVRALVSAQGRLENLSFDGRGGMTISALTKGRILRLTAAGHVSTLLPGAPSPGGERTLGRYLYTDRTASQDAEVDRISISNPRDVQVVGHLGVAPDDMTADRDGTVYVAGFINGKIYRPNPRTHVSCAVASRLSQPTSARFGGVGWHARDLYVTDAGGHGSELRPPPAG